MFSFGVLFNWGKNIFELLLLYVTLQLYLTVLHIVKSFVVPSYSRSKFYLSAPLL